MSGLPPIATAMKEIVRTFWVPTWVGAIRDVHQIASPVIRRGVSFEVCRLRVVAHAVAKPHDNQDR